MKQEQFIVCQSRMGFAETVEKLSAKIVSSGWKISIIHDLQETLRKNGKDVLPIKIIEICKPEYSGRLLEVDSLRVYSPLMPCRISVYQTADGATFISRMNSGAMASQIGGLVEQVMSQAFKDIEQVLSMFEK